ncbi:hypothetical protein ACLK17_07790 [Escherichia coli]
MASRILSRTVPFRIGLIEVYTSCSVGIALSPEHGSTARLLFVTPTQQCTQRRKADEKNLIFTPEMNQRVFEYLGWIPTCVKYWETISWLSRKSPGVAKCAAWKH